MIYNASHFARRIMPVLLFAVVIVSFAHAQSPGLIVNTSHNGEVEHLRYVEEQQVMITAATDGSVRIWEPDSRELLRSLQVSHLPIRAMTAHPTRPEVAVLVRTTEGYRLSVWDYESRDELYFEELSSEPLHMNYSPQGTWLVYSRTAAESVVTLNSETGERERRVGSGTGIVGYFTIGASEANIMSYAPANGRIQYTRLEDGEVLQTARARSGLDNMHVLANRRYAAARRGDHLVIVDILEGSEVAGTERQQIRDITVDPKTGRIAVLHGRSGERGVEIYRFANSRLRRLESFEESPTDDITGIAFLDGTVFTGGPNGRLALLDDDTLDVFASNVLRPIRSVAFGERSILLTADRYTTSIRSDFFGAGALDEEITQRRHSIQSIDTNRATRPDVSVTDPMGRNVRFSGRFGLRGPTFSTRTALRRVSPEVSLSRTDAFGHDRLPVGIDSLAQQEITISYLESIPWDDPPDYSPNLLSTLDNRILAWGSADTEISWAGVDGIERPIPRSTDQAVQDIVSHTAAVTLTFEDGLIQKRHPITFDLLQEHRTSNVETATFIRDDMLLIGRNAAGISGSALIRVDPATGETVNLNTEAFYIFRMAVDRERGAVYTLGLTRTSDGTVTTLERVTGDGLRETERLLRVPAEDLDADVTVDDRTGTVYVAAGLEGIIVWDGEARTLPQTDHLARRLIVGRGKVMAVNGNGTVSIWSQASESHLGDLYLFDDERWLAIGADGRYFSDSGMMVADLLRAPNDDEAVDRLRVELPLTFIATAPPHGVQVEDVLRALGPW